MTQKYSHAQSKRQLEISHKRTGFQVANLIEADKHHLLDKPLQKEMQSQYAIFLSFHLAYIGYCM